MQWFSKNELHSYTIGFEAIHFSTKKHLSERTPFGSIFSSFQSKPIPLASNSHPADCQLPHDHPNGYLQAVVSVELLLEAQQE